MKFTWTLCGLLLVVALVSSSPIVKREVDHDLDPLTDSEDDVAEDGDRTERDKRKIGVVKLGVSNAIMNFIFGKIDALIDASTHAIAVLDESNKAKNAAFDIDPSKSATGEFIGKFISQKVKATSGSIGPLLNGATTFLSTAQKGLTGALLSKVGPLSSLSGGIAAGFSGGHDSDDHNGGGGGGSNLLSIISSLSSSSGGISAGPAEESDPDDVSDDFDENGDGAYPPDSPLEYHNRLRRDVTTTVAPKKKATTKRPTTTTENIPEFDRNKVSLDIPPAAFNGGFNLVTNISKVLSSLIMNAARRTQSVLEVLKPLFRGSFAIKGLPSDNPK